MKHKSSILLIAAILLFFGITLVDAQANFIFSKTLRKGNSGAEVKRLQEVLAAIPDVYPEKLTTGYFGVLTRQAVQKFQTKYGIVSSGDENTTGYGLVGPKTRKKLNEFAGSVVAKIAPASPELQFRPRSEASQQGEPQASSPPSVSTTTSPQTTGQLPQQPTIPWGQKYLMAFHACDQATINCNDPRNHQTHVVQSDDGRVWASLPNYKPHAGSVPDIIRRGNTLYVFNPGKVRRYRIDTAAWENSVKVTLKKKDGSIDENGFVDPSPILDEKGRITLFYLPGVLGRDPASCPTGVSWCVKEFRSATEVEGSDGTSFIIDDGNRAEITVTQGASDPDIFKGPDGYILYIFSAPELYAYQSADLKGKYSPAPGLVNGLLMNDTYGVPSGYYNSETKEYWTFQHNFRPGIPAFIQRVVLKTMATPLPSSAFTDILTQSQYPGVGSFGSPGIEANPLPAARTQTGVQPPPQPSTTATPQVTPQTQSAPTSSSLSSDPYGPQSPYQHSVMSAVSADGLNWTIDEKFKTIDHVSVPSAILRTDGAIILYFVDFRDTPDSKGWDTTDCMISSNGFEFQNADCLIRNLASPKAWDPAPLYINREYHLYYFASGLPIQNHEIHVATSSDGVNFTEAGPVFSYTGLVDPDVLFFKNQYLMYVFRGIDWGNLTIIAESMDGKNFQKTENTFIQDCGSTKPVEYEPGKLRFYCFWQKGQDSGKVVSVVSTDGLNFTLESGTRLAISGKFISDPYVIRMPDNTWRMYFKVQSPKQIQTILPETCYQYISGQKTEVPCSTLIQINPETNLP